MKTHLLALALMLGVVAAAPSASAAGSTDAAPSAYPISWRPCPDRPEVQCGTLRVPLDWARLRGEKITLALARHRATDPAHRIGALFVNPGGPGGGGAQIALLADAIFSPEVVARFDVVGVAYKWAHVVAGQIRGSVVFTRLGDGHTSYLTSPCTRAVVDRYLIDGVIPGLAQVCTD